MSHKMSEKFGSEPPQETERGLDLGNIPPRRSAAPSAALVFALVASVLLLGQEKLRNNLPNLSFTSARAAEGESDSVAIVNEDAVEKMADEANIDDEYASDTDANRQCEIERTVIQKMMASFNRADEDELSHEIDAPDNVQTSPDEGPEKVLKLDPDLEDNHSSAIEYLCE